MEFELLRIRGAEQCIGKQRSGMLRHYPMHPTLLLILPGNTLHSPPKPHNAFTRGNRAARPSVSQSRSSPLSPIFNLSTMPPTQGQRPHINQRPRLPDPRSRLYLVRSPRSTRGSRISPKVPTLGAQRSAAPSNPSWKETGLYTHPCREAQARCAATHLRWWS
jgi:hypothetical protein